MVDRSRFRLVLKCEVELDDRIFKSREFHRDTDEGIHDLRDIWNYQVVTIAQWIVCRISDERRNKIENITRSKTVDRLKNKC